MAEYKVSKNKEDEAAKLDDRAWRFGREWGKFAADVTYDKPYPENEAKIKDLKEKMQKGFFDECVFFHPKIPESALTQLLRGFDSKLESEIKEKALEDISDFSP